MRPINIYTLSRVTNSDAIDKYEKALSDRNKQTKCKIEEIEELRTISEAIVERFGFSYCLENWFYSYYIPQISKEYDLLKMNADASEILNIELKSQMVDMSKIERQLVVNRYYLSHITKQIYSFTIVFCNKKIDKIYQYDCDKLIEVNINTLCKAIKRFRNTVYNLDEFFRPSDYLVSIFNNPKKFLDGDYFFTDQQDNIKKEVLNKDNGIIIGIKGKAGTGKSLLLYDIAREYMKDKKIGIIHSGILNQGHEILNKKMNNVSIISPKDLKSTWLSNIDILLIDEAQRLHMNNYNLIVSKFEKNLLEKCIFAYDYDQVLSKKEKDRNIPNLLSERNDFKEYELSTKIRVNSDLAYFIRNIYYLDKRGPKEASYKNVEIVYANTENEANIFVELYSKKGYKYVSLTTSLFKADSIDHFENNYNSHRVIGQEFDNVLLILDRNFKYSSEGILQGKQHPNPDYIFENLFYQNITRAREKICIIVLENEELFDQLLKIKISQG